MAARRPRTRRTGRQVDDTMHQLTETLQALILLPQTPVAVPFKPPTYNGQGDLEYFISRFIEVSDANGWTPAAGLLHLREALRDDATDCGKAGTLQGVFTALRARFGLAPREARARLASLNRQTKTPLHQYASEVQRLINIAYKDLPLQHQAHLTLETFSITLGHANLQCHLLAIQPQTLEEAVRAGNEFLQIQTKAKEESQIQMTEERYEERRFKPTQMTSATKDSTVSLMKTVQQLTSSVEKLCNETSTVPENNIAVPDNQSSCWGGGGRNHLQKQCTTQSWSPVDTNNYRFRKDAVPTTVKRIAACGSAYGAQDIQMPPRQQLPKDWQRPRSDRAVPSQPSRKSKIRNCYAPPMELECSEGELVAPTSYLHPIPSHMDLPDLKRSCLSELPTYLERKISQNLHTPRNCPISQDKIVLKTRCQAPAALEPNRRPNMREATRHDRQREPETVLEDTPSPPDLPPANPREMANQGQQELLAALPALLSSQARKRGGPSETGNLERGSSPTHNETSTKSGQNRSKPSTPPPPPPQENVSQRPRRNVGPPQRYGEQYCHHMEVGQKWQGAYEPGRPQEQTNPDSRPKQLPHQHSKLGTDHPRRYREEGPPMSNRRVAPQTYYKPSYPPRSMTGPNPELAEVNPLPNAQTTPNTSAQRPSKVTPQRYQETEEGGISLLKGKVKGMTIYNKRYLESEERSSLQQAPQSSLTKMDHKPPAPLKAPAGSLAISSVTGSNTEKTQTIHRPFSNTAVAGSRQPIRAQAASHTDEQTPVPQLISNCECEHRGPTQDYFNSHLPRTSKDIPPIMDSNISTPGRPAKNNNRIEQHALRLLLERGKFAELVGLNNTTQVPFVQPPLEDNYHKLETPPLPSPSIVDLSQERQSLVYPNPLPPEFRPLFPSSTLQLDGQTPETPEEPTDKGALPPEKEGASLAVTPKGIPCLQRARPLPDFRPAYLREGENNGPPQTTRQTSIDVLTVVAKDQEGGQFTKDLLNPSRELGSCLELQDPEEDALLEMNGTDLSPPTQANPLEDLPMDDLLSSLQPEEPVEVEEKENVHPCPERGELINPKTGRPIKGYKTIVADPTPRPPLSEIDFPTLSRSTPSALKSGSPPPSAMNTSTPLAVTPLSVWATPHRLTEEPSPPNNPINPLPDSKETPPTPEADIPQIRRCSLSPTTPSVQPYQALPPSRSSVVVKPKCAPVIPPNSASPLGPEVQDRRIRVAKPCPPDLKEPEIAMSSPKVEQVKLLVENKRYHVPSYPVALPSTHRKQVAVINSERCKRLEMRLPHTREMYDDRTLVKELQEEVEGPKVAPCSKYLPHSQENCTLNRTLKLLY